MMTMWREGTAGISVHYFLDQLEQLRQPAGETTFTHASLRSPAGAMVVKTPLAELLGRSGELQYDQLEGTLTCQLGGVEQQLTIERLAGSGKSAFVYLMRDAHNNPFTLKVVRADGEPYVPGLAAEHANQDLMFTSGINCTPSLVFGPDFLIKHWAEGVVGSQLIADKAITREHIDALFSFLAPCVEQRLRVQDLKPRNLVFCDGRWVCIDPGAVFADREPDDLRAYYRRYVLDHWFGYRPRSPRYLGLLMSRLLRR